MELSFAGGVLVKADYRLTLWNGNGVAVPL